MVSTRFADRARGRLAFLGRIVAKTHLTPNALTFLGLLLNIAVAAVIASGNLALGGIMVLLGGGFDVLDGAVARETQQTSKFGAFLDSTLDRYSEAIVFGGLLLYFSSSEAGTPAILLTYAAVVGSLMISYTRAKAEGLGTRGDIGFAQRLERVLILAGALLLAEPVWGVAALAILTQLTAFHRIWHVWRFVNHPVHDA